MAPDLKVTFRNPGKDYRSAPFWSWNDRMDPTEVRRQVRDMKAHGMGGFFMHSRFGLETEYMGPEWMQCIRAAVAEAKKIGMNAWLYDEDRWPSGSGGGMICAQSDEFKQKRFTMHVHRKGFRPTGEELAVFAVKLDETAGRRDLLSVRRLTGAARPRRGEVVLAFSVETSPPSSWFNGYPYGDNMSAGSVRAFLEMNYVPYVEALKRDIPDVVPGIFTDEPNIGVPAGRGDVRMISWSTHFAEEFQRRRGYSFLDLAPHFFFDDRWSVKTRHDYWRTVTELFAQNFSRQLGQYCRRSGFALTGHYNAEGRLLSQMTSAGATMPNYVWQDAPGIDILTEQASEFLTAKQCSSVASQFGRKWVLSELYGCTGWEFTFEGIKWVGDWQYALGVTLRCPHLTLYTLRGCAKRDYPPSFNYNNTWWKYNQVHEDYFARLGVCLTEGKPVRDVLLLHPIASAWASYDGDRGDAVNLWNKRFETVMRTLLGRHRDFDLGDEMILEDYGSVKAGRLRVKDVDYPVVVVPPMLTMSSATVNLLEDFLDAGGRMVAVRPLPDRVDSLPTELIEVLWRHKNAQVVESAASLGAALDAISPSAVQVRTLDGQELEPVLVQLRRAGKKRILFACSTDRDGSHQAEVVLPETGAVEEWDPLTGEVSPVDAVSDGERMYWRTTFAPAGSRLFVVDTAKKLKAQAVNDSMVRIGYRDLWLGPPAAEIGPGFHCFETHLLGPAWTFERTDPNVLTLDRCRYRLKGSKLSKVLPVWVAQRDVREKLGLRPVWDNGAEQRWTWVKSPKDVGRAPTEYHFTFTVDDVPARPVHLVLEGSEHFRIRLNGKNVPTRKTGWYLDRAMHKVRLPKLKRGENRLVLACNTVETMQVEDCYLIGDFGVDASTRAIAAEPETLHAGDWAMQGYTHYAGGIIYKASVTVSKKPKKALLWLRRFSATVVAARVNGKEAGFIPWRSADGLDVAKHLKPGRNRIEIEVMGSPRNMLGPLHYALGKPPWTGCGQFRTTGSEYTPDYVLWPWGLMEQVRIDLY
ncbi:MAG TPA: glycosyl hydrolase [Planctomycetota bacterium]|nr:glycosyl hydrolase [Planctomycetota bacterium]